MSEDRDIIADGPKRGRQRCCIIGCGRTYKDEGHARVMCGRHFRLGDPRLIRLIRAIERKGRRYGWTEKLIWQHGRLWEKVRTQAQERSLGI